MHPLTQKIDNKKILYNGKGYHQAEKDHQQTKELLKMLLEAIDYSFAQTDGKYDLTLTYPVIDKVKYIKQKLRENI